MKYLPSFLCALLFLGFGSWSLAIEPKAQAEIDYLIRSIETSDARFIRNGTEYTAAEGAAHMRTKLKAAGDRIKTADDFVAAAATKSSISGKPYMMKAKSGDMIPVGEWLGKKLREHRAAASTPELKPQ